MKIKGSYVSSSGVMWDLEYQELDNLESIRYLPVKAVGAICLLMFVRHQKSPYLGAFS